MLPFYDKKNDDSGGGSSDGYRRSRGQPFYVSIYRIIVGSFRTLKKRLQRKRVNITYVFIGLLLLLAFTIVIASGASNTLTPAAQGDYEIEKHLDEQARQAYINKLAEKKQQQQEQKQQYMPVPDDVIQKEDPAVYEKGTAAAAAAAAKKTTVGADDDDDDDDDVDDDVKIKNANNKNVPQPSKQQQGKEQQQQQQQQKSPSKQQNKEKWAKVEETQLDEETARRQAAVKAAMEFGWGGYVKYAWGSDELKPISKRPHTWLGMGASVTDALDTLWIMGMKDEFYRARDWIRDHFNPTPNSAVSFFETTIRSLGGLLSAYALSKDRVFIDKAVPLADALLKAVDENSGIPYAFVNLQTGHRSNPGWTGSKSILAEIGTVQLEFAYLSAVTGDPSYRAKAFRILDVLHTRNPDKALLPAFIDTRTGAATSGAVTFGALADSYYEYLLKLWLLLGNSASDDDVNDAKKFREWYDAAADAAIETLTFESTPGKLLYITDRSNGRVTDKMEHLTCFAGAMYALGAVAHNTSSTPNHNSQRHLEVGKGVTKTCYEMYARLPTGLSPETVQFRAGADFSAKVAYNILRPEAVESFFVLWRTTHDPVYREYGWKVFQAFERVSKAAAGYSGVRDVSVVPPAFDDIQPSWFFAETLKYLYLLFSPDDVIPLDEYVFNTEAHPLPIFTKQ